jgi:Transposase
LADDKHVEVEATWGIYQHMIAAYREPDRKRGRELLQQLISSISHSVPTALREVVTLGRTLKRRAVEVLAYFDRPGTSNGPTEAINGRLEHLRGSALGFRNLPNYIARSLLETGGSCPDYTLDHEEPGKAEHRTRSVTSGRPLTAPQECRSCRNRLASAGVLPAQEGGDDAP